MKCAIFLEMYVFLIVIWAHFWSYTFLVETI